MLYLFLDAVYLALRQGTREKEGGLCAYTILENGKKVLLHLALGSRESYDAWTCFLHDMTARGLEEPLLVVSDKHKGLKKAVREVFPHALKQPCLAHKMRNILSKLPKKAEKELKELVHQVLPQIEDSLKGRLKLRGRSETGAGAYRPFQGSLSLSYGMLGRRFGGMSYLSEIPGGSLDRRFFER